MYKSYKAYVGTRFPDDKTVVDQVLDEINKSGEYIISVTTITEGGLNVLIITQEPEPLQVSEGTIVNQVLPDTYLGAMTKDEIVDKVIAELNRQEILRGRS